MVGLLVWVGDQCLIEVYLPLEIHSLRGDLADGMILMSAYVCKYGFFRLIALRSALAFGILDFTTLIK